jgi:O-antigen/teichoic acid export membrane protein
VQAEAQLRNSSTPESSQPPPTFRRRFLSNAFWSIAGRAASIGCVFLSSILLARQLPTEQFSAYTVASALVTFLAMIAASGAPRVILRLIREGRAADQPRRMLDGIRGCMLLVSLSSLLATVVLVAGAPYVHLSHSWAALREYALPVALWMSLSAICISLSHILQGFDDYRGAAMAGARNGGIIANVLFLAVAAICAKMEMLDLRIALALQVALNLLAALYAGSSLRNPIASIRRKIAASYVDSHSGEYGLGWFFRESWPILVIQLTSLGIAQIDIFVVAWLCGDQEVAAFGAISRLCEILASSHVLSAAIAAPFVSELFATGQLEKLERFLRGIASVVALPVFAIATIYLVVPAVVLSFCYGPKFVDGAVTLQIATIGACVGTLTGLNSITLIMVGRQRDLLIISIVANAIYLLIIPFMVMTWGIAGAAAASAIVFGSYNLLVTFIVRYRIGIWTFPSLSLASYRVLVQTLMKPRMAARR